MKKIFLFICLILMFISCGKFDRKKYSKKDLKKLDFNKNYDFKHKESFMGEASHYEWNLECIELNCSISYLNEVKNYSNKITLVLKDYKQKNKIMKQIVNGMKKPDENVIVRDYYPESKIAIYDKNEHYSFETSIKNEEFYKVLDNLLGKSHKKLLEELEKKDLKKLDFSKNYDFKHKEAVTGNSDYFEWNLECEKLNCNVSYLHGVKKYSRKIVLKDYKQKNNIIKKIINGMKNPNENVVIDDHYPESKIIIYDKNEHYSFDSNVENKEFYKILDNLLGENHERLLEKL